MQIDLYKNLNLVREGNFKFGQLRSKDSKVSHQDLGFYSTREANTPEEQFHIASVLEALALGTRREFKMIRGKLCDSHVELEKLNICEYTKEFTTILSLEDSLDYILHKVSKASISNIRNIPGYNTISRSILKMNFDGLEGFTMNDLIGVDPNLDEYLVNLLKPSNDVMFGEADHDIEFLWKLSSAILNEASSIIEYVGMELYSQQPKGTAVIRSKSFCTMVMTTTEKLDTDILLASKGADDYIIKVRSFGRMEYLNNINLRYAE